MSLFVDQILVQLSDPTQLAQILAPAADPTQARLHLLLEAVYDMPFAVIHDIRNVRVTSIESERALFPLGRTQGGWTQTIPNYAHTDMTLETQNVSEPIWLDLLAQVDLTLVLEVDPGQVESILTHDIEGFDTLDEFRARFRFIALDAFMARHGIKTVEELKEAYQYLITEIRLRTPPVFDPGDPANQHHFTLNVACLIRDTVDVAAALRAAKLLQTTAERTLAYRRELDQAEVRTPYAPVVIFPETGLNGSPFAAAKLQAFFANEHILSLFLQPT